MSLQRLLLSFFILLGTHFDVSSQIKIPPCPLDSADFKKNYQWRIWQRDTTAADNVANYLNYFVVLQRNFLPSNFDLRKEIKAKLNKKEIADLKSLDSLYLSEVAAKRSLFLGEKPGFNDNLPPFTYLNFVMVFEVFKAYPDVYAMLLNPDHGITKSRTKASIWINIDDIMSRIQKETAGHSWKKYHSKFEDFRTSLMEVKKVEGHREMWQGLVTDDERLQYDWINFLMWCVRDY